MILAGKRPHLPRTGRSAQRLHCRRVDVWGDWMLIRVTGRFKKAMVSGMDDDLALLRRARMRWNAPLSLAHADVLLDRLDLKSGLRVVDLGCGWGELLMCAVERVGGGSASDGEDHGLRGIGVDTDPVALERGRMLAPARAHRRLFRPNRAQPRTGAALIPAFQDL
jgi:SAM-dependent methyltransferase